MYFIVFLIALCLMAIYYALKSPVFLRFKLDSEEGAARAELSWLSPLLRVSAGASARGSFAEARVLGVRVKIPKLKNQRKGSLARLRAVSVRGGDAELCYGFSSPAVTGIVCGALASLDSWAGIRNIRQYPDYIAQSEYFRLNAALELDAAETLKNLIAQKSKKVKGSKNMDQMTLNQNVDTLFKSLESFTQNEGIIGKPVTQGDKTFLPVVSIAVGYGGGNANMGTNSSGTNTKAAGSSESGTGALGLGAKLCTDAVIFIDKDNVTMLPVNSNASTIMDKIPQIISSVGQNKQAAQPQSQQNQQNQQSQNKSAAQNAR